MYSQPPRQRRNWLPFVIAGALAILLIVVLRLVFSGGDDGDDPPPAQSKACGSDGVAVNFAASSEKAELLREIAKGYNGRKVDGKCVDVLIQAKSSGGAMQALAKGWDTASDGPQPDIWSPAGGAWVTLLTQRLGSTERAGVVPVETPSIAQTPLVIAMPRPMAEALGWPKKKLGWADLLALSNEPQGWAKYGHPEWGKFRLGKTNPNFSTSGLNATIGAYFASTGRAGDLSDKDLANPKTKDFVRGVERSIVHYGDTTLTFLSNLQRADDEGRGLSYISAVTVEEKSVWDYNQGNPTGDPKTLGKHGKPRVPLAAIYPKEGTLVSDNPYVVLATDPLKRKVADDFLKHLQDGKQQERFTKFAFRTHDGKAKDLITQSNGLLPDEPGSVLKPPIPQVLDQVLKSWSDLRKPANVLLVIDTSGSMKETVAGTGLNKLELAKKAAINAIPQFGREDRVGLWMFSTMLEGNQDHRELVPMGKISESVDGQPRLEAIKQRIQGLPPEGGTGLYDTVGNAYKHVTSQIDPEAINAVVFLTDGRNEDPTGITKENLISQLKGERQGVRVFTIAYGADADLRVLKEIAEATTAIAYDSSKPGSIDQVFTAVISNF